MSTKIEWTDETWSPVRVRVRKDAAAIAMLEGYASLVQIVEKMAGRVGQHCEHVSAGCEHCYAETNNHRCLPANGTGLPYDRRSRDLVEAFVDEKVLLQPLRWKSPRKIFVENQSDIFGEWVTDEMRDRVFAVMALCPQHTFQVLTKRPQGMLEYLSGERWHRNVQASIYSEIHDRGHKWDQKLLDVVNKRANQSAHNLDFYKPLSNVWLGVSVENQAAADERIPLLLQTPAAKRFVSCEPLLGAVNLNRIPAGDGLTVVNALAAMIFRGDGAKRLVELDWVICGGESGPGARPMHPDWARGLRDACVAAGVPFFFKQWGEWQDGSDCRAKELVLYRDGRTCEVSKEAILAEEHRSGERHRNNGSRIISRVGKKAAGHLLDGVEWHQFPTPQQVKLAGDPDPEVKRG